MKRIFLIVGILGLFLSASAQDKVSQIDALIPSLQFDQDFLKYSQMSMLDGFDVVKQVNGYMKFVKGKKVYAVEKVRFAGKNIKERVTYFYYNSEPIAIAIEKKDQVKVCYLDGQNVIATKTFDKNVYKPYGGSKKLNLSQLPKDDKVSSCSQKYLEQAQNILTQLKEANQKILNYRF